MERALRDRGHELDLAVLDRRGGGKRRFLELRQKVQAAPRPDVVWAHFLVPSGLIASSVDAPLVVTAHGRDVRNVGTLPGVAALTRRVVRRAQTVIAVSDYLRRELELKLPEARGKTEVVDSGVDLERFAPVDAARRRRSSGPAYVAVGSLTERKNVVRLADAFARLGRGSLTFVGDGPLRGELEGRERVRVVGRVPHDEVPAPSRRGRRRLRAVAARAVRPVDPGGDGVRPHRRRDPARRPARVRPARRPGSSSTRSTWTSSPARSRPQPRSRARTRPRAPPRPGTTSGFRRSGWRRSSSALARGRRA